MRYIKENLASIKLLTGIIIGGLLGVFFGEKMMVVEPIGQLFLNFLFMILVPLVFFSVSSSIANMEGGKRLGKIMLYTMLVFIMTAMISAIIAYLGVRIYPLIDSNHFNVESVIEQLGEVTIQKDLSMADRIVGMLSVEDFQGLFSKNNMLAVIIFSIIVGLATLNTSVDNTTFKDFLNAGNTMIMKVVDYIMYLAPIGLGCYFASSIGQLGSQLINGYARTMLLYCLISIIYFFGVMTFYAFIANGKTGIKDFWANITTPALTAIATCSSAASIPVNIEFTKKMNVADDIAETVIPLGANTHKDGSVIGGVFKIAFLFVLFGRDITTIENIIAIIFGGFFVGLVMGSIPGGGAIAETMIAVFFGFPTETVPLIMIISTIIDIPATLLNSAGNTVSAMMVQSLIERSERKKK
ncbi:dicarboxylate/amino acid:cation symporter [Vagococcus xieshaowenii]|uniref:Dicarboxylate/amino acid:cation symporter n=1 Tax=Vagococcus xieshaowenii TaxID=2562451 RepID=A0A4Z0DD45_9ENTE|nr:dicarboxylate/amino acid:cation symporter [Vagococcus xieshaowenii]QCA28448.1 dicarboxylate/amino acid:cation symporter [Vagococcus xieshaowenii]TFZ42796.1 dicarboxylate/amino acid:cation symporter [Vagococcus xieshaowenii]